MSRFRQFLDEALASAPRDTSATKGSTARPATKPGPAGASRPGRKAAAPRHDPKSLATGAAAAGILGLVLGGGRSRSLLGGAVRMGGAAVVGGLAYRAYRNWQDGRADTAEQPAPAPRPAAQPAPRAASAGAGIGQRWSAGGTVSTPAPAAAADWSAPAGSDFAPAEDDRAEALAEKLLRAMVAAAKADGHVTTAERRRIANELHAIGMGGEAESLIAAELDAPLDPARIAAMAFNEAEALEIYAASMLVVDPEAPAERAYLADLAARLRLEPGLVARLHAEAEAMGG